MKKIFILGLLFAPIVAHATDPIGPSGTTAANAVVATASAPYATATLAPGDSTTVVSASYVKGAYNDAIAAVNKLDANVQIFSENIWGALQNYQGKMEVFDVEEDVPEGPISAEVLKNLSDITENNQLVTGMAVKNAIDAVNTTVSSKRVNALATWGSNSVTKLELSSLPAGN